MQIVAIGGGKLKKRETLPIDRFVVELTGRRRPRALFIPTASGDAEEYCHAFDRIYGERLGCRTDWLRLLASPEDRQAVVEKIEAADLIYVGGGNTLRMMKLWRRLGVDRMLESAGNRGAVLAGLSAGAICWHDYGHSDSRAFSGKSSWSYIRVRGLGFRPVIYCPHLDAEKRKKPFSQMMRRHGGTGIACDNKAAIWHDDDRIVVKTANRKAAAYLFWRDGGRVRHATYRDGEEIKIGGGAF